jgi:starch-binding outer membrane protein, SusD/RagB family
MHNMMNINFRKTFNLTIPLIGLLMCSCLDKLEEGPIDPRVATGSQVYTTTESYKQGLAKIYASYGLTGQTYYLAPATPDLGGINEGFSNYSRLIWAMQEYTTDEAIWSYPNDGDGTAGNLNTNTWTPDDKLPEALFARIMYTVALSNEFIRVTASKAAAGDPDFKKFNAEARFLRALSYYYGIDFFGKTAFVTEADKPGAFFPKQISRSDLFAYLENELKAIKADLGAPRFEYGRADKAACSMLLAKLYLNAEVYLGGQKKYTEAITELKEVIASGYTLAPKYTNNFRADNHTSPEIIYSINFDSRFTQSFNAVQNMIYGNTGNGGWAGLRTRSSFVGKFTNLTESRAIFATETKGQSLEINSITTTSEGYGVFKFQRVNADGSLPPFTVDPMHDTDFPVFRLADAYLMYAEAVLRGGTGGDATTALSYINQIRTRPSDVAAGNAPGTITSGQLTLDFILDERARELYWEAHRRTDLIRFGKYTGSEYVWPWKGGVREGTSIESKRALFPIPASDLAANPNLKQNDGY